MKKLWIPLSMAALVAIGCGGSGSGSSVSTTGTTAGGTAQSVAAVNLPSTPGYVYFQYLTGQGRAAGDVRANVNFLSLGGAATAESRLQDTLHLLLNGYTDNTAILSIPSTVGANSVNFSKYELLVTSLQVENFDGSFGSEITGPAGGYAVDQTFDSNITVFPGRTSTLQVYLDDATLSLPDGVTPTFDRTLFLQNNTSIVSPVVTSFLSDYISFDISAVASKPTLSDGSVPDTAYFNGDQIALSNKTSHVFEVYTPGNPITGTYSDPVAPANIYTYTLKQANPNDLTNTMKITSLLGTMAPATQTINNLGVGTGFEVILLPHTSDDNQQDIIAFTTSGSNTNKVTNIYFGLADLTAKTFALYPILDAQDGSTTGEVDGTFSSLLDVNGAATTVPANVRSGGYTFTTAGLPAGFSTTGRFIDYRK